VGCARAIVILTLAVGCALAADRSRVTWDTRTLRLIERDGAYGRVAATPERGHVFVCERGGGVWWRQSRDAGSTWSEAQRVAEWDGGRLANPELLALGDGALLCFHNRRPREGSGAPYAIAASRLEKGSDAWSAPATIYEAGREHGNGCWEPAAVQVPAGEIQLVFANEAPYRTSDEQEISLMRSQDGGRTWSQAERVGFRARHRDGMPVPLVLKDGSGVAVVIEDNGLGGGAFKPAILFTALTDAWRSGTVTGEHAGRWAALAEPLPARTYAGAPYLRQMLDGETALAFQMSGDGEMLHSRIAAGIGDARARGFGGLTHPFPETPGQAQLWPALCVKDAHTVTVLATLTLDGVRGVWCIDGLLSE
jgi:hypothetical protein